MTTEFQWIIDNAVDLTINKRAVVAQTVSRDQTVRAVSRNGNVWRFVVTPSPGARWTESRGYIEKIDKVDKFTVTTINFADSAFAYLFGYQGNVVGTQTMSFTQGSDIIGIAGGTISSGFRFKSGDLIQPSGSTHVYSVVADVAWNATSALLNRPILETTGSASVVVGQNVNWSVMCTQLPDYKIVSYDRVEWTGEFAFMESLA
jgi:hypothetical protein